MVSEFELSITRTEEMRNEVNSFHRDHPQIWDYFVEFTLERIARGFKHYSADAIMHRVRWETDSGTKEFKFKVNNNYIAFYSRRFANEFPQHYDFFRTRKQTSKNTLVVPAG